jgi:hypothetical protein
MTGSAWGRQGRRARHWWRKLYQPRRPRTHGVSQPTTPAIACTQPSGLTWALSANSCPTCPSRRVAWWKPLRLRPKPSAVDALFLLGCHLVGLDACRIDQRLGSRVSVTLGVGFLTPQLVPSVESVTQLCSAAQTARISRARKRLFARDKARHWQTNVCRALGSTSPTGRVRRLFIHVH